MVSLKNTALAGGGIIAGATGLELLSQGGVETASASQGIIGDVASNVINVLENVGIHIGDLAPISQAFIDELSSVAMSTSIVDGGIALAVGAGVNWIGKKGSKITGKLIGIESESDDTVAGLGLGTGAALGVLGAGLSGMTIASGTTGYIIGKKLGEKILGEKYAKISGIIGGVAATSLVFGIAPSLIAGGTALAIGGNMIWKAGENSRVKSKEKKELKKNKRLERKKNK